MQKLYNDLYIGIPSGIKIDACVITSHWTVVSAAGNVGFARTLNQPDESFAESFAGAYLRDTANYLTWKSPERAAVGVASLNAWHNTAERTQALSCNDENLDEDLIHIDSIELTNLTLLDKLDSLGGEMAVILDGPDAPLAPVFFSFGMPIKQVRGLYAQDPEAVLKSAKEGKEILDGTAQFLLKQKTVIKLHETENAREIAASPYKATGFINNF